MQCRQGPGLGQALEQVRVAGQEGQGPVLGEFLRDAYFSERSARSLRVSGPRWAQFRF